jgi:hypothetical protein
MSMTPPEPKNTGSTGSERPDGPANRGGGSKDPDKDVTRTGELSLEQVKAWLVRKRSASKAKTKSDEDGGAPRAT